MGQVLGAGQGQITARQAAVNAGIPMVTPATTVNKVLSFRLERHPPRRSHDPCRRSRHRRRRRDGVDDPRALSAPGARSGYRLGDQRVVDSMMHDGLFSAFDHVAMGMSADVYSRAMGISRERQDELAAMSHERAAAAIKEGRLKDEIVPVSVPPDERANRSCSRQTKE